MEKLFTTLLIILMILFIISTFVKRDYKKQIHRAFRKYSNDNQDGLIVESIILYFPLPYKSSNPDFYNIKSNAELAKTFRLFRRMQFGSFLLLVLVIMFMINFGF